MTLTPGGIRKGELYIISTPRQTGKSLYNLFEEFYGSPMKKEPKYKFSRKWYEVTFTAITRYGVVRERIEWCDQNFGKEPKKPDAWCRWYSETLRIRFRDAQDYEWYMLRWG